MEYLEGTAVNYFHPPMKTKHHTIAVLDFGGQYTHLIANRIRRLGVYSEIVANDILASELLGYQGIILSGSPHSVLAHGSPRCDSGVFTLGKPILGLCYGHQLMANCLGGALIRGEEREYGIATMSIVNEVPLFKQLSSTQQIWMSHGDSVGTVPQGFTITASTDTCPVTGMADVARDFYGLQFHPEVTDTPLGMEMLSNFLDICKCERTWNPHAFMEQIETQIRDKCAGRKVFLLVSGGVDSTVCFALLNKVLGPAAVIGLHVDNGLMRYNESAAILEYMKNNGFANLSIETAADDFVGALAGIAEPEAKRNIIGNMFLEVKESAQAQLGLNSKEWMLGQGTIYPDTIESAGSKHADRIKTHHNRVDIILELIEQGLVIEPLAQLYKDEVRLLGETLGIPRELLWRHPFPGPGLGVRLLCSKGDDGVDTRAQAEVQKVITRPGYSAVVLPLRSVGVQGDSRTYAHPALLDGPRNWQVLEDLSTGITNSVRGVNRVVYNISGKNRHYREIAAFTTTERLNKLRAIDHIVTEALFKFSEYDVVWQMPVVLLPLVDADGNECVVLRPVKSQEAMTARFYPLSDPTLAYICENAKKIDGVGEIFIDVTHKPPATIEWE